MAEVSEEEQVKVQTMINSLVERAKRASAAVSYTHLDVYKRQ